jgi:hypothetical protein
VGEARPVTTFASASRLERLLMVLAPAVAMAAVALGLRLGARGGLRAAVVYGAPPSAANAGLAWPVVVFDEDRGAREPSSGVPVDVVARMTTASAPVSWQGVTNADGVVEALLDRTPAAGEGVTLEVRAGSDVLARGAPEPPPFEAPPVREAGWLPFARREGRVVLDVALLGQRAAPGFPAELWVRATDAATHAPVGRVAIELESDPSLAVADLSIEPTNARGWTRVVVTPVGLAVTATLDARSPDGRSGTWTGGLFMSPGAPALDTRTRWAPGESVALEVTMPTVRPAAYVEIDDASGRAWAAALPLEARGDGTSHAAVVSRALAPGLYWAVASDDANGGRAANDANATGATGGHASRGTSAWGAAAIVRPFFVAASDEAALAFGPDADACVPPRDPRETSSAVSACLALSVASPVPRWIALDGFAAQRALDRDARARGLAVALGAIAIAILLEGTLLLRSARGRGGRRRTVAVAVLVGLLGFALLAAFIVRV